MLNKRNPTDPHKPLSMSFMICFILVIIGMGYFMMIKNTARKHIGTLQDAIEKLKTD